MQNIVQFFQNNEQMIYLIILMIFLGVEIISKVPAILHTPLMSGANAIHGVIVIGSLIVMGESDHSDYTAMFLGFLAIIVGTLNVVGGFVVTDRMLGMFKTDKKSNKTNE